MRDLFYLHATGLRGHEDDPGAGAVEHETEIQLACDGRARLDEQALHLLPLRAGLVGDDHHRIARGEELFGGAVGLFKGDGHLAIGDGDSVLPQDVLGLIFVNLHELSLPRFEYCSS